MGCGKGKRKRMPMDARTQWYSERGELGQDGTRWGGLSRWFEDRHRLCSSSSSTIKRRTGRLGEQAFLCFAGGCRGCLDSWGFLGELRFGLRHFRLGVSLELWRSGPWPWQPRPASTSLPSSLDVRSARACFCFFPSLTKR